MSKQRCAVCGKEEWADKLRFCPTDQIWLCFKCCIFAGLADPRPRCPRCYRELPRR